MGPELDPLSRAGIPTWPPPSTRKRRTGSIFKDMFAQSMTHSFPSNPAPRAESNNPTTGSTLESYLHICQSGTEVLVNVGFQDRIKMLELDVSYQ